MVVLGEEAKVLRERQAFQSRAYMMSPGDEQVVADRLHAVLSKPMKAAPKQPTPPAADVSGRWVTSIQFAGSASEHTLFLQQDGTRIVGTHQGDFVSRDLSGSMDGAAVRFVSSYTEENGDNLMFDFAGTVTADGMSGTLDMGSIEARNGRRRREHEAIPGTSGFVMRARLCVCRPR